MLFLFSRFGGPAYVFVGAGMFVDGETFEMEELADVETVEVVGGDLWLCWFCHFCFVLL